jgi:hypothetical protein
MFVISVRDKTDAMIAAMLKQTGAHRKTFLLNHMTFIG